MNTSRKKRSGTLKTIAGLFLVFAIICFITSSFMDFTVGKPELVSVPVTGLAELQSFTVEDDKSVYLMKIKHSTNNMAWNSDWSTVNVEVMDKNKKYLFGFGDEFWRAEGYDEGRWTEVRDSSGIKITFPKKGTYYLSADMKKSSNRITNDACISIIRKKGSSLPFLVAGILSIVLCWITYVIGVIKQV